MQTTLPDLIRGRQSFLLTGHENPDGDCIGAQIALYHLLVGLGKQAFVVNPDPIARSLEFLLASTPIGHLRADAPPPDFEVAVLLDCCQLSRTGAVADLIAARSPIVAVVDHHVGSDGGDGAVNYVDAGAAATGALVRRLYRELDRPLTKAAAEGVFLSLVSDTGWFRYSNTDAEVLTMAAELVGLGVDSSWLYDQLHRRMHPGSVGFLASALERHELRLDGRLAALVLDRGRMERAARIDFDTDLLIDPLRSIEGVEVVALFKERFDGNVKLSLRAKGDVDVQRVAAAFGGGGHKKAAGASLLLSIDAAKAAVEAEVAAAIAAAIATTGSDAGAR